MILRKCFAVSSAAAAHRKAISLERERVTRPVRFSTPDREPSITLVLARHLGSVSNSASWLMVNQPAAHSRKPAAASRRFAIFTGGRFLPPSRVRGWERNSHFSPGRSASTADRIALSVSRM